MCGHKIYAISLHDWGELENSSEVMQWGIGRVVPSVSYLFCQNIKTPQNQFAFLRKPKMHFMYFAPYCTWLIVPRVFKFIFVFVLLRQYLSKK